MSFPGTLLGDQIHVKLLVLAQLHNENRIFGAAILILIEDRDDTFVGVDWSDVISCHIHRHLITWADSLQFEVHLASRAIEELASWATLTVLKIVHIVASQRNQADPVSNKLIMQGAGVLMNLNLVDSHSGNLRYNDTSE